MELLFVRVVFTVVGHPAGSVFRVVQQPYGILGMASDDAKSCSAEMIYCVVCFWGIANAMAWNLLSDLIFSLGPPAHRECCGLKLHRLAFDRIQQC